MGRRHRRCAPDGRARAPNGGIGRGVSAGTNAPSLLGGSIALTPNPCRHEPARHVRPWLAEEGTAGTVAVIGAGKMGLPLAAQFASHGWSVIAVDIDPRVV